MQYFTALSESVENALVVRGVDITRLCYCVRADLDGEGNYIDTYLTFDYDKLYILTGYEKILRKRRGRRTIRTAESFDVSSYTEIPLAEIEKLELDRQLTTARLVLTKVDGTACQLARLSLGQSDRFHKFIDRLFKVKRGDPIDDSQLKGSEDFCPKCHERYPDPMRKVCPNCMDKGSTFKRLLRMYLNYKKEAVLICVSIAVSTALSLILPYFSSQLLYDQVLTEGGRLYGQVAAIVLSIALINLLSTAISAIYSILIAHITPKITADIRTQIFSKLQTLSVAFFTNKQTGSLMTRVENDANNIFWFFEDTIPYTLVNLITIVGLIATMFWINIPMTLIVAAMVTLTAFLFRRFHKKQRPLHRKVHIAFRSANAFLSDTLNGQRVVKAFAKEKEEIGRYAVKNDALYTANYNQADRFANVMPFVSLLNNTTNTLLLALGAVFILFGNLTLGGMNAMFSYSGMLANSINFFFNLGNRWARCVDAAQRMFEILDAEATVRQAEHPVRLPQMQGNIQLEHVSFEYDPGRPVIQDVSFEVKAGQMFGIVGKTGAGKSTIIHLISRLYDVTEGRILIDGVDIRDIAFEDLRHNIGVVSQETYLFIGTIADNIRYARPEASMEEVIEAAKAAFAHEFILKQPEGYDTLIGAGGVALSGGERQRLSIARAILQKPSILILDEATASMDTRTERKIQGAISRLKEGRTILSIAHRLSTLRDADQLAVIEHGELAEMGTHAELIAKRGRYYNLHRLQTEAFQFIGGGGDAEPQPQRPSF